MPAATKATAPAAHSQPGNWPTPRGNPRGNVRHGGDAHPPQVQAERSVGHEKIEPAAGARSYQQNKNPHQDSKKQDDHHHAGRDASQLHCPDPRRVEQSRGRSPRPQRDVPGGAPRRRQQLIDRVRHEPGVDDAPDAERRACGGQRSGIGRERASCGLVDRSAPSAPLPKNAAIVATTTARAVRLAASTPFELILILLL